MGKLENKIGRIRNNPQNGPGEDLISILQSLGYIEQGGSGSH